MSHSCQPISRLFLFCLLPHLFVTPFLHGAEFSTKPNILFIVSDDQGWRDIGYQGSEFKTPVLDQLAKEGVKLKRHYVYPTCSPTRVGLISGRNPSRYNILGPIGGKSKQSLPVDTVTVADMLKSAGYFTAISGKWHLGLRPEVGPRQYGFDSTYGYLHGQIDPYTHKYKFGDKTWHRDDKLMDEEGHATDLLTNEAIRIITQKNNKPFFLYLPYSVPHYPLDEPDKWMNLPDIKKIKNYSRRLHAASLRHMDASIGKIIDTLEKSGKRKNTLIIFTSDNGGQKSWSAPKNQYNGRYKPNDVLGDNLPLRGWKVDLYEGGVRVPAFVNWQGKLKPGKIENILTIYDWYPTLVHLAGVTIDSKKLKLDGKNIWKQIADTQNKPKQNRYVYWRISRQAAIVQEDWKLIETTHKKNPSTYQLFNLFKDPYEKKDISAKHLQIVEELKGKLARQRAIDNE